MKVTIVGAGTMGAGIAQVFATHPDYQVLLCDVKQELADAGKAGISRRLNKLLERGKMEKEAVDGILSRITTGLLQDAKGSDLAIEVVTENMGVKKAIFTQLKEVCGESTLYASNTSSLSITEMASETGCDIVGMHFFNPAERMALVEVIAGENTDPKVVERTLAIAKELGKTPVQVKEGAGFVVNRILVPMINEGIGVFADGTASAQDIDTAMQLGANHPMGPLALGDLIGLDVCLAIMEVLQAETGEDKYRPHPLLRKMVRAGKLGRKTKLGFFDYRS